MIIIATEVAKQQIQLVKNDEECEDDQLSMAQCGPVSQLDTLPNKYQ